MARYNKPYLKDLTPFAKGGKVVKHTGKGSREQDTRGGESLTGGNPYQRMANQYPKAAQEDLDPPDEQQEPPPVPMGERPASQPTAMMPGGDSGGEMGGDEEEE